MNPKRTWASLLIGLLSIQFAGCAGLPGWMSASNSTSSHSVTSIQAQLDIARLHEHQKKFIQARKMYLSILDDDPRNANAYHRLGVVLTRMGKQDEAIPYYQRAIELNPMSSEILSDFGYALFLNDDFEIAEEALQQALAIDPTHKRSIGNLAMVRGHQGYFKDCLSLFREIVPEAEAYANLAFIHVQRGEGRLAIQRYGEALSINDNLESAAEALVQIAKLQNRVEGHAPGLNNPPARDSYVVAAKNSQSFETDTAETHESKETDSPIPGQWWNGSTDFVLAGATTETTAEAGIAVKEFSDEDSSIAEISVDQTASDEFSTVIYSVAERSSGEASANEFAEDGFVPEPQPLAENSQDNPFEAELKDSPGVVRIGSRGEASDVFNRY